MNKNMEIKHEDIKTYILDECNADQLNQLNSNKINYPVFDQLINIIDELKQKAKNEIKTNKEETPGSFSEIDSIILELNSGTIDSKHAERILRWLSQSPVFFEKLFTRLNQVSLMQIETDLPELQEVSIKNDEEILEQAGILSEKPIREKIGTFEWNKELFENIITWIQVKPKLAYALIIALIIAVSSPFGLRFYHTSYQLMLAENILQENYRIYMSDTPRLSGGYPSTGISVLMSEDEEEDSFLSEAFEKTKIANEYDSELIKAKQLQAQIYFIEKQYAKADSVLKLLDEDEKNTASILNDLGVINFTQGNIEKSIQYFKSALKSDPKYKEVYYNLALANSKNGKKDESITLINKYLKLENDEGWRNAALNFLEELK